MTLAAILLVSFLTLAGPSLGSPPALQGSAAQDAGSSSGSQAQTPPMQSANPAPVSPSGQPQNSPSPANPSPQHRRHHKKTAVPDCSNSAPALNPPGVVNPPSSTNTESTNNAPADGRSLQPASHQPAATNAGSAAAKPCPPPKVVVKNGGSDEPTVQLKENTTAEQASQERSTTEQLTAATEGNLKRIAGRQLTPSQQEMVNQVKEFMEQSKKAIAAGDLERGHNLAMKARLLSDELVKPSGGTL